MIAVRMLHPCHWSDVFIGTAGNTIVPCHGRRAMHAPVLVVSVKEGFLLTSRRLTHRNEFELLFNFKLTVGEDFLMDDFLMSDDLLIDSIEADGALRLDAACFNESTAKGKGDEQQHRNRHDITECVGTRRTEHWVGTSVN